MACVTAMHEIKFHMAQAPNNIYVTCGDATINDAVRIVVYKKQ